MGKRRAVTRTDPSTARVAPPPPVSVERAVATSTCRGRRTRWWCTGIWIISVHRVGARYDDDDDDDDAGDARLKVFSALTRVKLSLPGLPALRPIFNVDRELNGRATKTSTTEAPPILQTLRGWMSS